MNKVGRKIDESFVKYLNKMGVNLNESLINEANKYDSEMEKDIRKTMDKYGADDSDIDKIIKDLKSKRRGNPHASLKDFQDFGGRGTRALTDYLASRAGHRDKTSRWKAISKVDREWNLANTSANNTRKRNSSSDGRLYRAADKYEKIYYK